MKANKGLMFLIVAVHWILMINSTFCQEPESREVSPGESLDLLFSEELSEEEFQALVGSLEEIRENPININGDMVPLLADFGLISALQLNKLKEYIFKYGSILSLNEIRYIEGWDDLTAQKILPFVTLGPAIPVIARSQNHKPTWKNDLMFLSGRVVENSKGYIDNATGDSPEKIYSGTPWRHSIRYDLSIGKHLNAGIRTEKDPGEKLLPYHPEYPVRFNYPDHLSGYLMLKDFGFIKKVCLGDFHICFGRGITLASGGSFSTWKDPFRNATLSSSIKGNTSMSEWGYLRGISVQAILSGLTLDLFFSIQKMDPSGVDTDVQGKASFTSFSNTGYHRTSSEISKRGLLEVKSFGITVIYSNHWIRAGIASYKTSFSIEKQRIDRPYAGHQFKGKEMITSGGFFEVYLRKSTLYSELSLSGNTKISLVAGWQAVLSPGTKLFIDFRHFPVKNQPGLYVRGQGPYGTTAGETGLAMGMEMGFPGMWVAQVIFDYARNSWFSYGVDFSAHRQAFHARLTRSVGEFQFIGAYTFKQREENQPGGSYLLHSMGPTSSHQLDARIITFTSDRLRYKSRVSGMAVRDDQGKKNTGIIIQQEISYHFRMPAKISTGGTLFHTDGYTSRFSVYEPGLLYSSGNILLYGRGVRSFIAINFKAGQKVEIWIKAGRTWYSDRNSLGGGADEIQGNKKTDISGQIRCRF